MQKIIYTFLFGLTLLCQTTLTAQFGLCGQQRVNDCQNIYSLDMVPFNQVLAQAEFSPTVFPGCPSNVIDNPYWFEFRPLTTTLAFSIISSNCWNGAGIQAAIYEQCPDDNTVWPVTDAQCACTTGPIVLQAFDLIPGESYILLLDGCAGDICDVDVVPVAGQIETDWAMRSIPDSIPAPTGKTQFACEGPGAYSIPRIQFDSIFYQWRVNNSANVNGIILAADCNQAQVQWSLPDATLIDEETEVIVDVFFIENGDTLVRTSDPLVVSFNAGTRDTIRAQYCQEDNGFFFPLDRQIYPAGVYDLTVPGNSSQCDLLIHLIVEELSGGTLLVTDTICAANCVTYGRQEFCTDTTAQIVLNNASANGCDSIIQLTVVDLRGDTDLELSATPAACVPGQPGGTATAIVTGSLAPFTYLWNTADSTSTITDLPQGWYFVTVTASNGCFVTDSIYVDGPIDITATSTPANCDSLGGTATAMTTAQLSNPLFEWSNGGVGPTQTNLSPGGYSVTLTDQLTGCKKHTNVIVEQQTDCYVVISGYVYKDTTNSCVADSTSEPFEFARVMLGNNRITFTNADGYYQFRADPGDYTVRIIYDSVYHENHCADSFQVSLPNWGDVASDNNFFLKPIVAYDFYMKINKGRTRPGREHTIQICVMNRGQVPTDGQLTFTYDPEQMFVRASPDFTQHDTTNRQLVWDFTGLANGQVFIYRATFILRTDIAPGTLLNMDFRVDPTADDLRPDDNVINDCSAVVRAAYDPNDKQAEPAGTGPLNRLEFDQQELSYQIRFQNTGNDTAFTVILTDQLDDHLDATSVIPGPSSHDYTLDILDGNILEFTFDNILLPDSNVNLAGSQGFVFFDVRLKDDVAPGSRIENFADIYFDFNPPIRTNTVFHTVRKEDVLTEQEIQACEQFTYNGQTYFSDTLIVESEQLVLYDSTTETQLFIFPEYFITVDTTMRVGDSYDGVQVFNDTLLQFAYQSIDNCDSLVQVQISVITTATHQLVNGQELLIAPNPTHSLLYLRWKQVPRQTYEIELRDMTGRRIKALRSTGDIQLDCSDLPAGTYLLQARGKDWQVVEKIVVLQ